jgi:hypothetical protein
MTVKTGRGAHPSMEIMSDFRLRSTNGPFHVSNRMDQPFAGNCGNKWLALGSEAQMKQVGDDKDSRAAAMDVSLGL